MLFIKKFSRISVVSLSLLLLAGCSTNTGQLKEGWRQNLKIPIMYTVNKGDTLYMISFSYGLDYQQVAKDNHIRPPYHIKVGQKLKLIPPKNTVTRVSFAGATGKTAILGTTVKNANITWTWPTAGVIDDNFAQTSFDKGIDIEGKIGDPVYAAATGKVVYAGTGLHDYGALVIIKHNSDYLSAYAHNQKIFVHEGQTVKIGQKIGTMGNSDTKKVALHFEIRQDGKPVDPMRYLPPR